MIHREEKNLNKNKREEGRRCKKERLFTYCKLLLQGDYVLLCYKLVNKF